MFRKNFWTKLIQTRRNDHFFGLCIWSSGATRHTFHLNVVNYRVKHIFCRTTPAPPKENLPLIGLKVIIFLWLSAHPPSCGQWYYDLIELEGISWKILQTGSKFFEKLYRGVTILVWKSYCLEMSEIFTGNTLHCVWKTLFLFLKTFLTARQE